MRKIAFREFRLLILVGSSSGPDRYGNGLLIWEFQTPTQREYNTNISKLSTTPGIRYSRQLDPLRRARPATPASGAGTGVSPCGQCAGPGSGNPTRNRSRPSVAPLPDGIQCSAGRRLTRCSPLPCTTTGYGTRFSMPCLRIHSPVRPASASPCQYQAQTRRVPRPTPVQAAMHQPRLRWTGCNHGPRLH